MADLVREVGLGGCGVGRSGDERDEQSASKETPIEIAVKPVCPSVSGFL
jgi:hypothetical protein